MITLLLHLLHLLRLSRGAAALATAAVLPAVCGTAPPAATAAGGRVTALVGGRVMPSPEVAVDRKSTRLNSSHTVISYAVFCLKKKKKKHIDPPSSCG